MKQEQVINATDLTAEFADQLVDSYRKAFDKAKEASKAYFEDLENRKTALQKQSQVYKKELEQMAARRNALAASVTDLTSRGMIEKAAQEDEKLEELDKTISATQRKQRLANTSELKGDPKHYNAAKTAHDDTDVERKKASNALSELYQIANLEILRLKEIQTKIGHLQGFLDHGGWDDFHKVDHHYRELDRLEREAKEKAAAERKAAEAERGSTRRSFF